MVFLCVCVLCLEARKKVFSKSAITMYIADEWLNCQGNQTQAVFFVRYEVRFLREQSGGHDNDTCYP